MNEDRPPDTPNSDQPWERWKTHRRSQTVDRDFTDRVMALVTASVVDTNDLQPRWFSRIGSSPWGQMSVCAAAMLVGMLPFLYLVLAAKILTF